MKQLLADIWSDLREKRLWPVAVVLALGLVAVPVVLSKPADQGPPPPAPQARSAPEPAEARALASVELEQPQEGRGSSLDSFDPANPFRPPEDVVERTEKDPSGDIPSPGGGSIDISGELETDAGEAPTGGDGGTAEPTPTPMPTKPDEQKPAARFQYVVDITFTANGEQRRISGMRRLDLLPSEEQPFLLFLGVESGGDNAVFLVDSTLQAAGEGSCRPSPEQCAFVHIGPGSEHAFTNDAGDSYTLRVDEIRIVKATAAASKASRREPRADASVRRFTAPDIADLVERP